MVKTIRYRTVGRTRQGANRRQEESGIHPARATLAYPAKSLEVVVDTFDYERTVTR